MWKSAGRSGTGVDTDYAAFIWDGTHATVEPSSSLKSLLSASRSKCAGASDCYTSVADITHESAERRPVMRVVCATLVRKPIRHGLRFGLSQARRSLANFCHHFVDTTAAPRGRVWSQTPPFDRTGVDSRRSQHPTARHSPLAARPGFRRPGQVRQKSEIVPPNVTGALLIHTGLATLHIFSHHLNPLGAVTLSAG